MSKDKCSILIVDDEPYILATLSTLLKGEFDVLTADCASAAREIFALQQVDLILSDQRMPGESGVELLEWCYHHYPQTVRLLMTGFAELEEAVEAINRARIYYYIFKPWRVEDLLDILHRASHLFRLERDNNRLVHELQQLNRELEQRVQQRTKELEEANHELEQKNKMLERLALTDPLTSLPNRRAMDRLVERELRRRERYPSPVALGLLDIDHFKRINSKYLLSGGDKVLVDLTRCVANSLRTVDIIGRVGGEEFLILAPETDTNGAAILGERIRATVDKTEFHYQEHMIHVTVSLGFSVASPTTRSEFDQLRHSAAAALSEAKRTGRNKCVVYPLDLDEAV